MLANDVLLVSKILLGYEEALGSKKLEISHASQILKNDHPILVLSYLSKNYCKIFWPFYLCLVKTTKYQSKYWFCTLPLNFNRYCHNQTKLRYYLNELRIKLFGWLNLWKFSTTRWQQKYWRIQEKLLNHVGKNFSKVFWY